MADDIIYAIGDVHGEAEMLDKLHAAIFARHEREHPRARLKLIHLGDYIDRGPDSCGVIETLMKLEGRDDVEVVNLRGNHEQMMLDAYEDGASHNGARMHWLMNGGDATLESYAHRGFEDPPQSHMQWLHQLPSLYLENERKIAFVHAGVDPKSFPNCDRRIHLWSRSPRFYDPTRWDNGELKGWQVVHGHTPTKDFEPQAAGAPARRFNLDTGAVYGGQLSAGIFAPGKEVEFLSV
ncbi:metallophosphoesterase family protein [Henriciella sp. AS95]|uniref:metallophosphoesterase family protein n=1 Tax=Henriciella sp. AS95 TaxID=3135782 RepID=UPI0031807CA6